MDFETFTLATIGINSIFSIQFHFFETNSRFFLHIVNSNSNAFIIIIQIRF